MFEKIRDILSSQMDIDEEKIHPDTDIFDDLALDSLDVIEMLTSIEDEYSISIPQDALQDVRTVGQVAELIEKLV